MTKATTKQDTRTALLKVGMEIMTEKGYTNTGIQEILSALQVPKGSFYHYFDSKENYAVEIIQHFDQSYSANLLRILRNGDKSPLNRLIAICEESRKNLANQNCRKGCLIGNLSQEMADQSEVLRQELSKVMAKRRDIVAACIEEGQKAGEITDRHSARALAELYLFALSGAVMQAKTEKTIEPLDILIEVLLGDLLKA